MASIDTLQALIALIDAAGGQIDARIKIQKEAYLLAVQGRGGFSSAAFTYHHYGPYSREISDTLQFAVSSNLLLEEREPGAGSGVRYSYSLTPEGRRFLSVAGTLSSEEASVVRELNSYHWRALELAATVLFLQQEEESLDEAEAFGEALRLKPDTKEYQPQAAEVLSKVADLNAVGFSSSRVYSKMPAL